MALTLVGFMAAAVAVVVVGPFMARTADLLSKVTGLGGALFGVLFLALATDLPEVALTPAAVLAGRPRIALGSLLGSAVAQLALLAVADLALRRGGIYRRVGRAGLAHCALLIAVLGVPVYFAGPGDVAVGWVSVGSVLMVGTYAAALTATRHVGAADAAEDAAALAAEQATDDRGDLPAAGRLWLRFLLAAAVLAAAGVVLEATTARIGERIGLGETAAGALIAGAVTSLPELVTAVAAVRQGAVALAVGDIAGSSALDVALVALVDAFHTEGSVFSLFGPPELRLVGAGLVLTALMTTGVVRRGRAAVLGAAVESYLIAAVYAATVFLLLARPG